MEKLKFEIKEIVRKPSTKWIQYPIIGGVMILVLLMIPLLLVFWLLGNIYNLLASGKRKKHENLWFPVVTQTDLELECQCIGQGDLPDFIYEYFEGEPIVLFKSNPKLEFFQGYFADFRIEQYDGIFIQKVILNQSEDEIISLPLYFFEYASKKAILIRDLKGYDIDAKGGSDDFIISAIGEENELEIRFTKE
jgi:hypothetical protein